MVKGIFFIAKVEDTMIAFTEKIQTTGDVSDYHLKTLRTIKEKTHQSLTDAISDLPLTNPSE